VRGFLRECKEAPTTRAIGTLGGADEAIAQKDCTWAENVSVREYIICLTTSRKNMRIISA